MIFGDNEEEELGHGNYLLLIVSSSLSALLIHSLLDARTFIPCVGASGFISGIIACYAICFPKVRLSFMLWNRSLLASAILGRAWFSIPAWGAFAIWTVLQILLSSHGANSGGTAFFAHLGGMLPGILFAVVYRLRQRHSFEQWQQGHAIEQDHASQIR